MSDNYAPYQLVEDAREVREATRLRAWGLQPAAWGCSLGAWGLQPGCMGSADCVHEVAAWVHGLQPGCMGAACVHGANLRAWDCNLGAQGCSLGFTGLQP